MRDVARLVTLVERDDPAAPGERADALHAIEDRPRAPVVGITGAPGVGKSTLLGAVAAALLDDDGPRRIAILAVDPSSAVSGGALLGDRTRIQVPSDRVFVRSQASQAMTGGLAPSTYPVVRALRRLFDLVLLETVGVGQSEDDVRHVADATYLLLQPLAGDALQHLKAGVMEAPDALVVTKCDAGEVARRAVSELEGALGLARPGERIPVHAVSARTGAGVAELAAAVAATSPAGDERGRDDWYLTRAVLHAHGRRGVELLTERGLPASGSLDERLAAALARASS
jgi:LAO/AO transport system kinase